MGIVIRAARRRDLPEIYRLLDTAFADAPVELFINQTEGDSTMRPRHVRVAEVDGVIAAHVRIFARRMLVRGVPVRVGGIGSVASAPDARGLGLPSALLNDCIDMMTREEMALSFLFTGIPAFYERIGYKVARQSEFRADATEGAAIEHERGYRIRRVTTDDLPALLRVYRRASAASTGAIVRTERTWRDAQAWLGEDPAGCLIAEWASTPVAYVRSRSRPYGYHILEAEHVRGHESAIAAVVARAAKRASALRQELYATAGADTMLATVMRALPSTRETEDMRYPTMMRIVSLEALVAALMPQIDASAGRHRGAAFRLGLCAPDGQAVTLDVGASRAQMRRGVAAYSLDEASTLDALLGQRRASAMVRPRPPREIARRIDALLPEMPLRFWNSDRI